jgi:probable phosphoglycerate mutase
MEYIELDCKVCPLRRVILVRHGQAENNLYDFFGGWSDAKLTELGIEQAHAVANRLSEELNERYNLYSSDLIRAKQTAEIIQKKLGIPITYSKELREHNPGIASGMRREEVDEHLQEVIKPLIDWRMYPEAETFREFYQRVTGYMDRLDEVEENLLIVSHGGTIHNILRWWIGTPVTDFFKFGFRIANTSITMLDKNKDGQNIIERLNDTTHYTKIGIKNSIE